MHVPRIQKAHIVWGLLVSSVRKLLEKVGDLRDIAILVPSRDIETEKPSQLTRKENANFRTSKKKNEKIWILKTVYGKHSIYFSDFLKKFKFSDRPFGEVL